MPPPLRCTEAIPAKEIALMNFRFINFARLVVPAMLCCSVLQAEEWRSYRGLGSDGKSTESIDKVVWNSGGPKVLWKTNTPLGFSSFAVADSKAFTITVEGEKETCVAMDAATGNNVWRYSMGSSKYEQGGGNAGAPNNRGGDGPRSTPTFSDGKVYIYDSYMVLHCLSASDGKLQWKHDVIGEFAGRNIKWLNASSPVVHGSAVIVGGGGESQSFLAFDKNDGKLLWKTGDEMITHATPTLTTIDGQTQVIFFAQSGLIGLDVENGKELWRCKFPYSVSTAASPVVDGDQVYCSAGYGVGAGLFKVNGTSTADELWFKSNELMNHWSTPVIHDGHLYGLYEFKKYGKAPLQCVDLATGEIKWKERGYGPGNCILVGDKLVVLSDAGEVAIVAANPNKYQEIAKAKVLSGKCWSTPAFSDGKIYVRSTEEAACIDLAP